MHWHCWLHERQTGWDARLVVSNQYKVVRWHCIKAAGAAARERHWLRVCTASKVQHQRTRCSISSHSCSSLAPAVSVSVTDPRRCQLQSQTTGRVSFCHRPLLRSVSVTDPPAGSVSVTDTPDGSVSVTDHQQGQFQSQTHQ